MNCGTIQFARGRLDSWLAGAIFLLAGMSGLNCWLARPVDFAGASGLDCGLARPGGLHCRAIIRMNRGTVQFAGGRLDRWLAGTVFLLAWMSGLNCWLTWAVDFARAGGLDGWLAWTGDGLHGWTGDGCDGTRGGDQGGTALVHVVELLAILCGFALVLILRCHWRDAGAAVGCELGGLGADVDAAAAAVVGDAVDGGVVDDDCAVIDVGDTRDVDVVDRAVVVEVATLPIAAMIAAAGVAEAVVDTAVEADVRAPEAAVKVIAAAEEAPVAGGPEGTVEGRRAPGSGDPVVADGGVSPVAGGPEVVGRGGFGLLVDGEWRRGLVGLLEGLLAGVYL
jgi:hypothetical protein